MVEVEYKLSDDDFTGRPVEAQNLILFRMQAATQEMVKSLTEEFRNQPSLCDARFRKLERRKWLDKGMAMLSGGITGIATALGIKLGG